MPCSEFADHYDKDCLQRQTRIELKTRTAPECGADMEHAREFAVALRKSMLATVA